MKFLYIAPEHVSGTLSLFQKEHRRRGDECRYVTFWHSRWDFPDDICLDLPLMPDRAWVRSVKKTVMSMRGDHPDRTRREFPPYWEPGFIERFLFKFRDAVNWPVISRVIEKYNLRDADVIVLDGGLDLTRDCRFVRSCRLHGCRIVCFYHGSDMRNRGIVRCVDGETDLRLTSEWDLIELDNRLRYLFLPCDTSAYPDREYRFHSPVRIAHATRNPYKGTDLIKAAVRKLQREHDIELVLIEGLPHAQALSVKRSCDIFIDQLTNAGGWGYGMSSVEALAMGMPVITNLPQEMEPHLDEHPFIKATPETVLSVLENCLKNEELCRNSAEKGKVWVREYHDVKKVCHRLYGYFKEIGCPQTA